MLVTLLIFASFESGEAPRLPVARGYAAVVTESPRPVAARRCVVHGSPLREEKVTIGIGYGHFFEVDLDGREERKRADHDYAARTLFPNAIREIRVATCMQFASDPGFVVQQVCDLCIAAERGWYAWYERHRKR